MAVKILLVEIITVLVAHEKLKSWEDVVGENKTSKITRNMKKKNKAVVEIESVAKNYLMI